MAQWRRYFDDEYQQYYYANVETGETTWEPQEDFIDETEESETGEDVEESEINAEFVSEEEGTADESIQNEDEEEEKEDNKSKMRIQLRRLQSLRERSIRRQSIIDKAKNGFQRRDNKFKSALKHTSSRVFVPETTPVQKEKKNIEASESPEEQEADPWDVIYQASRDWFVKNAAHSIR